MSGKPIRMSDLIPVKFTLAKDDDEKKSLIAKEVSVVRVQHCISLLVEYFQ
jgi:hypothetical protein